MKRRLLAVVCVTASLLTACGVLPGGGEQRRTVTVWLMKDSASKEFLKRFTEDFEDRHGDLRLDIRIQQWTGIGEKVQAALKAEGEAVPDVIEVGNTQVAQYVDGGGLSDLTLESMRDWGMNDWLPGLAGPGRIGSRQLGIPWYAANRVVIYRKDLFAGAGIKQPPKTREQWLADTERLNTGGKQGIYLAGQDWYTLSGFIWDEGGDLADESSTGHWEGTLGTPAALRGMDFYRRLQALGQGPVDADEEHPPQSGVFAKGRVAQIVAVPGLVQAIERTNPDLKGKLGFFPVPGKTAAAPGAVFTGGSDLVVPENTDDRVGATEVVSALVGAKWQKELARTMNYVPNKTKLAGAVSGEEGVAAMAAGAAQGRATPSSPQWAAVEADNPIKDCMSKILGGADPATEARRASGRITKILEADRR
ncbi:extracellular solute-binding protein [Streptomyces sp. NBC_00638]|uniref:extracellular solute-binding protein n=1 Tax=unclassified Streptomyces TaxID=2593676 RepID=UPI00224F73AC|nr:extracellular solute-binding protein [Streptomyces sp. NBC_00638]MCX5007793.1 extracellular solute-binding protein [Streptomyces sp. NBC_00638]